tara:strand:+ start:256 stop:1230 length:975 start_codon:yes stop_codon:yes gene_type:complete
VFNYYPTPFPDEHLASVMYRAFILTYFVDIESHFKNRQKHIFFNTPSRCWVPAFKHLVTYFSNNQTLDRLLKQHSNLMDYSLLAISDNHIASLFDTLASLGRANWKLSVHIGTDRGWRYCPVCVNENVELYGTSYWHASHQRFYQRTCSQHRTVLKVSPNAKFALPTIHSGEVAERASVEEHELDKKLATIVQSLRLVPTVERRKRVIFAVKQKLNIADGDTSRYSYNGRRLSQLHELLTDAINTPEILHYFTFDKAIAQQAPFTSISGLYQMLNFNNQMHPLWYIILIHIFLNEDDKLIAFDPKVDWSCAKHSIGNNVMPIAC